MAEKPGAAWNNARRSRTGAAWLPTAWKAATDPAVGPDPQARLHDRLSVRVYQPEEIKAMSEEELTKAIQNDLYTNAYKEQEQREEPIAFRGKNLAENLETALYLCPSCERIGSLKSNEDIFSCSCGLNLKYTEYGYLQSINQQKPPFHTVLAWIRWQSRASGSWQLNIAIVWKARP